MHLSDRSKEAAVRSLEGPQTLTLTCVTSACQCHQGASIFQPGISLPVALRCTSLASTLLPSPTPPTTCTSRHLSLTCHFFHQRLPSSYLLAPALVKAEREPSEWKWGPLCPSSRFSCCEGKHIREVLIDSYITPKQVSLWRHWSSTSLTFDRLVGYDIFHPQQKYIDLLYI